MKHLVVFLIMHVSMCYSDIKFTDQEELVTQERRNGKNLLNFIGLDNGQLDPYQIKLQQSCLTGEFSECFKLQAVNSLGEFFLQDQYTLTPSVKVVRAAESQLRSLINEPLEYVSETREGDSEWDSLVKFALRKAERFVKSTAFEIQIPEELGNDARYSPRFIDDIYEEIDVLEDKKAPLFNKHRLKKMFIPMLLILKLFKLKLLLFLPFILGIAGLKKVLGFVAFVLPGVIGYFKLCKPNFQASHYSSAYHSSNYDHDNSNHYRNLNDNHNNNGAVKFNDDTSSGELAYQGYAEYRNNRNQNVTNEN
ncbi:uncharacterized protein LOC134835325 [Culicoides brevitarsis]|uniref:uncharacterized protein LOC134835325 n=1 Tax=Culicoides brevitarsis TaxID=469753 RepID=UPI00307B7395